MDENAPKPIHDVTLAHLAKEDLYDLSVTDLEERIASLKAEVLRCEAALADRGSSRDAAEQLFKR